MAWYPDEIQFSLDERDGRRNLTFGRTANQEEYVSDGVSFVQRQILLRETYDYNGM